MEQRHAAAMESAMEKLRDEMKAMVAQKESETEQASDDGNRPNISRALFQNSKPNASATYISSRQLRSLANTRSRS
ncbi:hypothetical protein BS78_09G096600 [Paspalum vaginatum]|nr:hypothetical protein BS78_09G096600 [Paspalum vaginatum]